MTSVEVAGDVRDTCVHYVRKVKASAGALDDESEFPLRYEALLMNL